MEVYVRPYPGPDRRQLVSTNGGTHPTWSRSGGELLYRASNQMMSVEVSPGAAGLTLSSPRVLFEQRYSFASSQTIASYAVSTDGQRFVMVRDVSDSGRLNLVTNWFEELRRLVPVD
jgi:hypothetical protein